MSKVLYRKYRPDTFEEVIGEEQVTVPLQRALANGNIAHAYLFSGPRGCGKTTSARIFARCLNCEKGPTPTPCGKCPSCLDLASGAGGSMDVIEMDAASHGGVDDARDLRERIEFAPSRDRYKIVILDEAHMITNQAFNALLKVVEEPPEHVKFIFATTEPEKVIGTIRSRTYHYPFRLVSSTIMSSFVDDICKKENIKLEDKILPMVIKVGAGSVRDTLSTLDQLLATEKDGIVEYDIAVNLLGFTPDSLLQESLRALANRDVSKMFDLTEQVVSGGLDPRRYTEDLLESLRNLILVSYTADAANSLLDLPADDIKFLNELTEIISVQTATRLADITNEALTKMIGATSPRIQLELLIARFAGVFALPGKVAAPVLPPVTKAVPVVEQTAQNTEVTTSVAVKPEVVETPQPAQPESKQTSNTPEPSQTESQPAAVKPEPKQPAQTPAANQPSASSSASIHQLWPSVLEALQKIHRPAHILMMTHSQPVSLDGNSLTISFENPNYIDTLKKNHYDESLVKAIKNTTGQDIIVNAIIGASTGAPVIAGVNSTTTVSAPAAQAPTTQTLPSKQPDVSPAPEAPSTEPEQPQKSSEDAPPDMSDDPWATSETPPAEATPAATKTSVDKTPSNEPLHEQSASETPSAETSASETSPANTSTNEPQSDEPPSDTAAHNEDSVTIDEIANAKPLEVDDIASMFGGAAIVSKD